jgi:hypothetical protein
MLDYTPFQYFEFIAPHLKAKVKASRLNFKHSNIYARWRRAHWFDFTKSPSHYERHKKPFFGITTIDPEFAYDFQLKEEEKLIFNSYTRRNHIMKAYTGLNIRQRAFMQYPIKFTCYGFPFNQRLIHYRFIDEKKLERSLYNIDLPISKDYNWQAFQSKLPLNYIVNISSFKKLEKFKTNANSFFYHPTKFEFKIKPSYVKKKAMMKTQLQNFKNISNNKKKFQQFNDHTKKISQYFKILRKTNNFPGMHNQIKVIKEPDLESYKLWVFHGAAKANEIKGEAAIELVRAKKRRLILLQRKINEQS